MKIVGCDLHTRYQQVAMLDEETGELTERRLEHESGEARAFYSSLERAVGVGSKQPGTRGGSSARPGRHEERNLAPDLDYSSGVSGGAPSPGASGRRAAPLSRSRSWSENMLL